MGYHIAIAGNIAVGKTTLTQLLSKEMGCVAILDPDPPKNPYVEDFYRDMERWAFHMQIHLLLDRMALTLQAQNKKQETSVIQDRTLYEDAEVFALNLKQMGLISERDYQTYQSLYRLIADIIQPPDLLIYLRGDISVLTRNITARNRSYEENINIRYLKRLNELYDHWFENYNKGRKLKITVDQLDFVNNPEDLGQVIERIQSELFGLF